MENQKNNVWKVAYYVGILLAVFLAVLSIKEIKSISYVGEADSYANQISINGTGEVVSIPDIATFSFAVTENAKVVSDVQTKATEKINKVIGALKENGVNEKDIKTTSYSINPHYEYVQGTCTNFGCPPGKSVLSGYDVSQSIEVKVRNVEKAGKLLEVIGSLNVTNVSGLSFTVDDIDKVKAEARMKAIENAKAKAAELSSQLGVRLVKITNFYDSSGETAYYYGKEVAMGGDARVMPPATLSPQLPQGEQKVTAKVTITYEIK